MDIGSVIPGQVPGNTDFRIRDMGGDPPHWEGPGGVPT